MRLNRFIQMRLLNIVLICILFSNIGFAQKYYCKNGNAEFSSDAPLELIHAASKEMQGIIDAEKKTFAFSISTYSFDGFNTPLQKEHFNENYMESSKFPNSSFTGKIIEDIDNSRDGIYVVRTKGVLTIHGVKKERIIKSTIEIKGNSWFISSDFSVMLDDHQITIPRIVQQKIASEIRVKINAELVKQL